jgi:fructokinase
MTLGVIIGTGTGGGIVIDRRVIEGRNGVGGEWGHNPLPWPSADESPGALCYCGRRGCIETFLSGPGLSADFERATGEAVGGEQLVGRAAGGDAAAEAALVRYEHRMARALASIINVLDPDVIVLGGGLSNIQRLYKRVPALWGDWVFSDSVDTPLLKAAHGDASGVRGRRGSGRLDVRGSTFEVRRSTFGVRASTFRFSSIQGEWRGCGGR